VTHAVASAWADGAVLSAWADGAILSAQAVTDLGATIAAGNVVIGHRLCSSGPTFRNLDLVRVDEL
jgi:hypothetical protein